MNEFTILQFVFLFGLSLIFSVISLNRQTFTTFLLAGLMWSATGLTGYAMNPTEIVSMVLSYFMIGLGIIFAVAALKVLGEAYTDKKERKVTL